MNWLNTLHTTYLRYSEWRDKKDAFEPLCHVTQRAHIEVTLNGDGEFVAATRLEKGAQPTPVPCTEESAMRTGTKPPPHPLHDKLQYLAGDFIAFGGQVTSGFAEKKAARNKAGAAQAAEAAQGPHQLYLRELQRWVESAHSHPALEAVWRYVRRGCLVKDFIARKIIVQESRNGASRIFLKPAAGGKQDEIENPFVRWAVQIKGEQETRLWQMPALAQCWIAHYCSRAELKRGVCIVSGEQVQLAQMHGNSIRYPGDKGKLISANDKDGFTFRGRFSDAAQACEVGLIVSQRAHSALRWLVARQAYRYDTQAVIAWHIGGQDIPEPLTDSWQVMHGRHRADSTDSADGAGAERQSASQAAADDDTIRDDSTEPQRNLTPTGAEFAHALKLKLAGYRAQLGNRDGICIMALDAATTGRLAITYYREFAIDDYLQRIEKWHSAHAWPQKIFNDKAPKKPPLVFTGVAAPKTIVQVCYGDKAGKSLERATTERILYCIAESKAVPYDLVQMAAAQTIKLYTTGAKWYQSEQALSVACGLYRGYILNKPKGREYQMSLEENYTSRDYLFGRLLAVVDVIERRALREAKEERATEAERMMGRFAAKPLETWANIFSKLEPYKNRLRMNPRTAGSLRHCEITIEQIMNQFKPQDFNDGSALKGEFLLGFYCQRTALWQAKEKTQDEAADAGAP